ncbi:MAG: hypothetical protein SGJ19_21015 [Planctomycetia bacterium]|nr:hypothetical protein [Planctomycetia bacterium]
MATIAPCPHCRQWITLPIDAIPDQRFQCPLCVEEFAVAEALAARDEVPSATPAESAPQSTPGKSLQVEFVQNVEQLRQAPSMAALQRRTRKSNWLGQLIGIIGGGVIGLTIGYVILLKLRGPEVDFLHVAPRLPAWASELLSLPNDAAEPLPDEDSSAGESSP